jgi:hypothetical protein
MVRVSKVVGQRGGGNERSERASTAIVGLAGYM